MSLSPNLRAQIAAVLEAAIRAVDPYEAIHAHVSLDGDILRIGGRAYHLGASGRILVVGGGKAGAPMAAALTDILGARITAGVVNVKYGHTATASGERVRFAGSPEPVVGNPPDDGLRPENRKPEYESDDDVIQSGSAAQLSLLRAAGEESLILSQDSSLEVRRDRLCVANPLRAPNQTWNPGREKAPSGLGRVAEATFPPTASGRDCQPLGALQLIEAGHPVPDAAGQAGAERIAALLDGLTPHDLVLVLISGGGSALLPLPVAGITLADIQSLTQILLRCGADITEINTIRKHLSGLQGGQLARLAQPASVATLILSDVVGTPLDAIASGPTVPDPTTYADAVAVLQRYGIEDQIPDSVRRHLLAGAAGARPETPKPGDPLFERVANIVIGDNASAGRAAVAAARRLGFHSTLLTTFIQGEAREVGRVAAGLAQGIACGQSDFARPACLALGGETTVTVRGQGTGGRNQELALAAAIALDNQPLPAGVEIAVVSLGTDGADGPTEAAGGIATRDTLARGRARGLDARAALADNDSYHYLGALDDLIITGPTNTNVNDLIFIFVT